MGKPIQWQYHLVWTPQDPKPRYTLYRASNAGHRFHWASIAGPARDKEPSQDEVLQELYTGIVGLMEYTGPPR